MKKKVGTLWSILRLNGALFNKDVDRQKSKIRQFAAFAKRAFAPLAAAAATIGSARGVSRTLDSVDAQAKLARSLGTTVESMQVLARAGDLAGVGQAQLEQGSKDLYRRLSQAATGSVAAAKALERLELKAGDLLKLPLDERISTINGAIDKFVPKAEQAAVAGALFGEEGSIAMTRLDPATLAQAAQEIQKFGRVISDVEAAKIEQANDSISRLGLVARGIGTDITVALAPALDAASQKLASWTPAFRGIITGGKDALVIVKSLVSYIFTSGSNVSNVLSSIGGGYLDAFKKVWQSIGRALSGLRVLITQAGSFGAVIDHLKAIASDVGERIGDAFKATGLKIRAAFTGATGAAVRKLGELIQNAMTWAERMSDIAIGAKDAMVAAFKALPDALGSLMYQAAGAAVKGVETLINGVVRRVNNFITSINSAISALPEWARGGFDGITKVGEVSLDGPANPYANAKGVGTAAGDAFRGAQGKSDFGPAGEGLVAAGTILSHKADKTRTTAKEIFGGLGAPLSSVQDLKTAIDEAKDAEAAATEESKKLNEEMGSLGDTATDTTKSLGGGVSKAAKAAKDKLKDLKDGVKGLSDELAAATLQGEGWGETLKSAFMKVAQSWVSNGIESIMLGLGGVGGTGGGFFGKLLGGMFGARAMGGGVRAGQIYQVNENTPRSEWLFASANGGMLNHGQMNAAVRQAVGGGAHKQGNGAMRVYLEKGLKAEFLEASAAQAFEIMQSGVESNNAALSQSHRRS
ncbi:hypothetical protein [Shimia sp. MIT910701]|uniref:hypothetical protein n=1 Tax=Shimia sp. MIT910701 TaxID=3096987 RepID=UPI00399B3DE2